MRLGSVGIEGQPSGLPPIGAQTAPPGSRIIPLPPASGNLGPRTIWPPAASHQQTPAHSENLVTIPAFFDID